MHKKYILFILLSVMILLSMACSNDSSKTKGSSGTASESAAVEAQKAYILTKVEAGTELPDDKLVSAYIREQAGVEPVFIKPPAGTYDEKLNMMLASDEPLDAFIVGDWTEFQKKGMIRPINDLLKQTPELMRTYSKEEWEAVTDKKSGHIYAIPFANTASGNAPRIRKDWLDALGLQVPATLEQFEKVLEAFKTTDKFGENVIPLATHLSVSQMDRAFMGLWTKHGDHSWVDTDGTVKPAILDPGYKDYIAKMTEWYAKGYIWKEAFSQEFTVINDLVFQNRVGVLATWVSVGIGGMNMLMSSHPEAEYVFLDKFEGPAGSAYSLRLPSRQGVAVSVNSKHPEAAMTFFNWSVTNKTNNNVINFGLPNKHWKWLEENKGIIERISGADKQYSGMYSLVQGGLKMASSDNTHLGKLWSDFYKYVSDTSLDLKKPGDYGTNYDEAKIRESVPSAGDIDKFKDKWLVKFITGQEPLTKWDAFILDLRKMGLDKMIEERTRQYKEQNQYH
ncbi:extracellular solute-binding protein [Paenibacillus eucommiae]|uniref:ABC-type glycerol-3-phosphate transport system substrate-binding protein n=1 Tax=Paenibacillus eucommiae TaxID=1355755 RepID=A0ABS4IUZ6_9BACL|nr:extracellular solute-binding protein [Paenibacillus eucommiae]MBP1991397.1 ABC-type glycerol-3-phosphate transport system substrate-binding protein [Paenibacillus eucommiae]